MQKFWQKVTEILTLSRLEKRWRKAARLLGIIVVFCTTYMLILPAITMEKETYCGFESHSHNDNCFVTESVLHCGYDDIEISDSDLHYSGEVTSEEIISEETTSEEITSEETTSEETSSEETSSEETTSEETTSEEITSEEITSEEITSEEITSEEITSEETASEEIPEFIDENTSYSESKHEHTDDCFIYEEVLKCNLEEHIHEEICFIEDLANFDKTNSVNILGNTLDDDYTVSPFAETQPTPIKVDFDSLNGSGEKYYIIYTYYNNRYYAVPGTLNGTPVPITVNSDGTITSSSLGDNLSWSFTHQSGSAYVIKNLGSSRYMHSFYNSSSDYGITTSGEWSSDLITSGNGSSKTFIVKSNSYYSRLTGSGTSVSFATTTKSNEAAQYYLAEVPYHVWFDGTCGGIMSLYESDNTCLTVSTLAPTITLPDTWKSPSKYDYKLNGWYDIKNHKYYKPGAEVTITKNTVFYADWVAATYDIGQNNDFVVPSLDTNSFIKTDMFDYSAVFNFQAVTHTGTVGESGHNETWSVVQNAAVPYNNSPSLGFIFRDWDSSGKSISYAGNLARLNNNQGTEITSEIIDYVHDMSGKDIIDILFKPQTAVIGKTYVGEANYLYQFMEEGSLNYDGEHNGYYYYDATLNAASYNQTDKRFYVYEYLERTSDSLKDSFDSNGNPTAAGAYSDFLPFNSPYANNSNNKKIVDYNNKYGNNGNYQYDAKATNQQSNIANAGTNYWFGMKSEIKFYLPNDTGEKDDYYNYGNISSHGDHMQFQFHGDDDLWVFIDGELVMDIGGLHGIMTGKIDFSTGKITTDTAKNNNSVATATETDIELKEGDHTLTLYYMERGGSQSNCAIYFNISPRYGMDIIKQDALSDEILNGAEFSVYTDEACTAAAQLWESQEAYLNGEKPKNTFVAENGKAYFWGISAGKVYYIKETNAPKGYPETDDIIRVAMNNLGESVCTTDPLRGENGTHTNGFDIIKSSSDESNLHISLTLTNQKKVDINETTDIMIFKKWNNVSEIPKSLTVYLTVNGVETDQSATLTESVGWTYTWLNLPKYDDNGAPIEYGVKEVQIPGFYTESTNRENLTESDQWIKTDSFRDGDAFLLVDKSTGSALSVSGGSFTWVDLETAKNSPAAQWSSIADGMGFHLENGNNFRIILNGTSAFIPSQTGNRILYYYDSKLFAQNGNIYYYFSNTNAVASDTRALEFELYRKITVVSGNTSETLSGTKFILTNAQIEEEKITSVSVSKTWSDGAASHTNQSVTVHLLANGVDTGRKLVLNRNSGWAGTFDGLPYLDKNGNVIDYSVTETEVEGYLAEYSESLIPGETKTEYITTTEWKTAASFTSGKIYRFVNSNGYALTANGNNNSVSSAVSNTDDEYQQWIYQSNRLKNVGKSTDSSSYYLYLSGSGNNRTLTVNTSTSSNYTTVSLSGAKLRIGSGTNVRYITLGQNSISLSQNSTGAVAPQIYMLETIVTEKTYTTSPSYKIFVTNTKTVYLLPETGGIGTNYLYIIGGLLISVCAVFLLCLYKKDRERRRRCI